MTSAIRTPRNPEETRQKLVSATRQLVLQQGLNGTGVDLICSTAGVTKGAFFHHFKSKDEIAKAALADWANFGMALYAAAVAEPARYPLDHLHKFFDIMIGFVRDADSPVTCVVGMISQEMALANPALRETCSTYLTDWADFARHLLTEARAAQKPRVDFDVEEVAWFLNSLWQGSMLIAKTRGTPEMTIANIRRARAYVDDLFGEPAKA